MQNLTRVQKRTFQLVRTDAEQEISSSDRENMATIEELGSQSIVSGSLTLQSEDDGPELAPLARLLEKKSESSKSGINSITDEEFAILRQGNHRYEDEGKIFHMAIIDYLQKYNCTKKCERCCVPIWTKASRVTISVAKPYFYGNRFYHFLSQNVFT